jgi:predicted nucleic acid-binding protein
MQLYIDLNCFNRPFDNQSQERIRLETEAVYAILQRIIQGEDTLVWSWVMTYENDKHPISERRDEIAVWERRAVLSVAIDSNLQERARYLAQQGLPALDAAHLASAEAGEAEVILTCDDVFLRRVRRLTVALRVMNPVAYFQQVVTNG